MCENNEQLFVNKIILNEHTIREILLGLWINKKGKNIIPVVLLMLALLCPVAYAFLTGIKDVILLIVPILIIGLACVLGHLGYTAYKAAKSHEKMITQIIDKYGNTAELKTTFTVQINYTICGKEKTVRYSDIKKIIELDMYLILVLENNIPLPIWKVGFVCGSWDAFKSYLKKARKL